MAFSTRVAPASALAVLVLRAASVAAGQCSVDPMAAPGEFSAECTLTCVGDDSLHTSAQVIAAGFGARATLDCGRGTLSTLGTSPLAFGADGEVHVPEEGFNLCRCEGGAFGPNLILLEATCRCTGP